MGMEDLIKGLIPPDFTEKVKTSVEKLVQKLESIEKKQDLILEKLKSLEDKNARQSNTRNTNSK
jgi:hypothetical protein